MKAIINESICSIKEPHYREPAVIVIQNVNKKTNKRNIKRIIATAVDNFVDVQCLEFRVYENNLSISSSLHINLDKTNSRMFYFEKFSMIHDMIKNRRTSNSYSEINALIKLTLNIYRITNDD